MTQEKERHEEIEEFFTLLEEKTEKYHKYFAALATLPQEPPPKSVYAQYGDSSTPTGEPLNARLEPNLRRA